jgi:hypothetical protein
MKHSPTGLFGREREMGYSRKEFIGLLPGALSNHSYVLDGNTIGVKLTCGRVSIRLGDERERKFTEWVRLDANRSAGLSRPQAVDQALLKAVKQQFAS